jgi:hypothetical protein
VLPTTAPATTKYVNVTDRVSHDASVMVAVSVYVPGPGVDGNTNPMPPATPAASVVLVTGFGFPPANQFTVTPAIGAPAALRTRTPEQHRKSP